MVSMASGSESSIPQAAVFLSYAREDAAAVRRIAEALRAAGVEVWFDENELRGGDVWDHKIRRQISECALFVPIVSANTQARTEGYFRLEWHLAEQRSLLMAKGRAFIVPVGVDATHESEAYVPDVFLGVQWARAAGDAELTQLVAQVQRLLSQPISLSRQSGVDASGAKISTPEAPSIPDFELVRLIGRGSYGDVWLARGVTGLWRAIKIVWRERFADAGPFEREFKGLKEFAGISLGESIQLALLHVGRNEAAGFFYYVMELADDAERGRQIEPESYVPLTFSEVRARRGRLPADECARFGVELARVLAGLHRRGLVHRDIKPSNVILVGGVPKLADIGLVAPVTSARTFVGTEGYVPPEGPGSPSADVYALGKVLYELATGLDRQEFPQLPPALNRLPDHRALLELNEIILRACDPLPERRHRDGAALLVELSALQAGRSPRRRRIWSGVLRVAAVVTVVAASMAVVRWKYLSPPPSAASPSASPPAATVVSAKSIAVLPFANRSPDKENEFFTDGVHEDILTNLTNIRELRVVSNTSVGQYRGTTKSMKQIGAELGVAYILEGSVQRVGNKVHVTGQLIDARTDTYLWAKSFDKDLSDVFAIQAELATAIAANLQAVLSPEEKKLVEQKLTQNPEAYDLYLKSRSELDRVGNTRAARERVLTLNQAAVELDPKFAAAWVLIASAHGYIYGQDWDHTPTRLAQAKQALDKVELLAPGSPLAIGASAAFCYTISDYARSLEQYESLARLQPNNSNWQNQIAVCSRRLGRWPLALAAIHKAIDLDPESIVSSGVLVQVADAGRRFGEADAEDQRWLRAHPNAWARTYSMARRAFRASGSMRDAEKILGAVPESYAASTAGIEARKSWAFVTGNLDEYLRLDALKPSDAPADWTAGQTQGVEPALVLMTRGDTAGARARLADVASMRTRLEAEPDNDVLWTQLGEYEALLGNKESALRCAGKAVELLPESRDPFRGPERSLSRAFVYAWTGDKDRAIAEYARLLRVPVSRNSQSVSASGTELNIYEMKHSPTFFPLRGDPRFEALLNDPKNNAPLF